MGGEVICTSPSWQPYYISSKASRYSGLTGAKLSQNQQAPCLTLTSRKTDLISLPLYQGIWQALGVPNVCSSPVLDWPFWCNFFTEGVVFHEELGNAKKPKPKCVQVLSILKLLLVWTKINVPVKAPMGESNVLYRLYHSSQCNPLWWFWFEYAWCRSRSQSR